MRYTIPFKVRDGEQAEAQRCFERYLRSPNVEIEVITGSTYWAVVFIGSWDNVRQAERVLVKLQRERDGRGYWPQNF